jgi:hypothetical protein
MTGRTIQFIPVHRVAFRFRVELRGFHLLINVATRATGSDALWMTHGWPETAIPVHIVMTMAAGTHHSGGNMYIQVVLLTIKAKCEALAAVTPKAGVHIFGFFSFENRFGPLFFQMTLIAAFHMTAFAIKLIIGHFSDFHKSALFFIPAAHALSGIVKALCKKRSETGRFRFIC